MTTFGTLRCRRKRRLNRRHHLGGQTGAPLPEGRLPVALVSRALVWFLSQIVVFDVVHNTVSVIAIQAIEYIHQSIFNK